MSTPPLPNRIAVTGSAGQLGSELLRLLGTRSVALPKASLDIRDAEAVNELLERLRPDVLVNTAAWTAVDAAETSPYECHAVNAIAVSHLAKACSQRGCRLVQISTDYVFGADRERAVPYTEDDSAGPLNAYGRSKLAGEQAARTCEQHLIVRTCGLYSAGPDGPVRGRNFLDTMLTLATQRNEVSVVADQRCTPSYVPHVAQGVLALIAAGATGTFHVTNRGAASWWELAAELFQQAGNATSVRAIASHEYPSPTERPRYSVLDTAAFEQMTGNQLPDWRHAVAAYVSEIQGRKPCSQSS